MPPSPQHNDARAVLEGGFNASFEKRRSLRLYLMAKRAVDIIGAATGIMILSPIFILVATSHQAGGPARQNLLLPDEGWT